MNKTEPIACTCIIEPDTELNHDCDVNECTSLDHYRKGCMCNDTTHHDNSRCKFCTPLKGDWKERFDEIGFGNQAFIVGAKRVELKDFIQSLLDTQKQEYIQRIEKLVLEPHHPDCVALADVIELIKE